MVFFYCCSTPTSFNSRKRRMVDLTVVAADVLKNMLFNSKKNVLKCPGTTSLSFATGVATPDTDGSSLEAVFTAEMAKVLGFLGHFVLLGTLSQIGTITSTVFTNNTYFLGSLGLNNTAC